MRLKDRWTVDRCAVYVDAVMSKTWRTWDPALLSVVRVEIFGVGNGASFKDC